MKKRFLFITAIFMCSVLLFSACGGSGKTGKGSDSEGQMQTGEDSSKVTIGDNSVKVGDSSINVGDSLKWPKELMADLPEVKSKITAVLKDDKTKQCTVAFSELSKEDAKDYVNKMKELGYSGGMEMADADAIIYNGIGKDGAAAGFIYNMTAKEGTIYYSPKAEGTSSQSSNSSVDSSTSSSIDLKDVAPWPTDFIKGVPELEGKIVDVVNDNERLVTVSLEYVDKAVFEAYIKELKQNGFTVNVDEVKGADSIDYRANNDDGEWVHAYLSIKGTTGSATVEMEKAEAKE